MGIAAHDGPDTIGKMPMPLQSTYIQTSAFFAWGPSASAAADSGCGFPHSTAIGSTSTATCTSLGSLIDLIVSRMALVSTRICFPRATIW